MWYTSLNRRLRASKAFFTFSITLGCLPLPFHCQTGQEFCIWPWDQLWCLCERLIGNGHQCFTLTVSLEFVKLSFNYIISMKRLHYSVQCFIWCVVLFVISLPVRQTLKVFILFLRPKWWYHLGLGSQYTLMMELSKPMFFYCAFSWIQQFDVLYLKEKKKKNKQKKKLKLKALVKQSSQWSSMFFHFK